MRWLTIVAAVAALALGLAAAGCGGGDDEASDEPDATLTETDTDETTTDEETTEEETDTDTGSTDFDFSSEECQELLAAGAALSQAMSNATSGGDADLSEESEAFQEFADNAPEEIRADLQVIAEAYDEIVAALADVDLQPGETPNAEQIGQLTAALASIDQADLTAASDRVSTWAQENCTTG